MPYPPQFGRLANYYRDQMAGLESPQPSKVDAEMNALVQTVGQMNTVLRGITTADGRLRGVPQAIAQALVATFETNVEVLVDYGSDTGAEVALTWDSAFSPSSVLVRTADGLLAPSDFTVSQGLTPTTTVVKTPTLDDGAAVTLYFFTPGTNILTQLAAITPGYGASMIGIYDAGGEIDATNVEDALQEIFTRFSSLLTELGTIAGLIRADGSVPMAAALPLGGNKITGLAAGSAATDAVNVGQISAYIAQWNALQQYYLKRDGSAAMSGPLNMGNQRITDVADPASDAQQDAVNVRSLTRLLSASGALPVGISLPYFGTTPPTGWLLCDGSVYKGDTYPVLYSIAPSSAKAGPAQGCKVATATITASGGAISGYTLTDGGIGYDTVPTFTVVNTDGGAAVTSQPTVVASVSAVTVDGSGNIASGGVLSITSITGGTGIRSGAVLVIGGGAAFRQMLAGYFRVPDYRGRTIVGAGTESKTPGILDAPDVTKGDAYNATARTVGDSGGEQKHSLTGAELAPHTHTIPGGSAGDDTTGGTTTLQTYTGGVTGTVSATGLGTAHENMPPFAVATYIIKAQ